jgi:hypothetical protein
VSAPAWLEAALEACHGRCLDDERDRAAVAEAIAEALPIGELVAKLTETISHQLTSRRVVADDPKHAVSRPIARNCVATLQSVLLPTEAT